MKLMSAGGGVSASDPQLGIIGRESNTPNNSRVSNGFVVTYSGRLIKGCIMSASLAAAQIATSILKIRVAGSFVILGEQRGPRVARLNCDIEMAKFKSGEPDGCGHGCSSRFKLMPIVIRDAL